MVNKFALDKYDKARIASMKRYAKGWAWLKLNHPETWKKIQRFSKPGSYPQV